MPSPIQKAHEQAHDLRARTHRGHRQDGAERRSDAGGPAEGEENEPRAKPPRTPPAMGLRLRAPSESLERLPRAGQRAQAQDTHEVQPEDDEDDAADRLQQRQVGPHRGCDHVEGHAEEREDRREAEHEGEGVGHGAPAGRPGTAG